MLSKHVLGRIILRLLLKLSLVECLIMHICCFDTLSDYRAVLICPPVIYARLHAHIYEALYCVARTHVLC